MYKASPFVKKILKDNNIDINSIKGSGPDGRIIKRDLPNNIIDNNIQNNEYIPTQIRKIIAKRTTISFRDIPHYYLKIKSNIDKLILLRKKINLSNKKYKISLNDLFIKALSIAQKNNPKTCASWINDKIVQYSNVDISVAVALEEGLITPVIKNTNKKGLIEISNELKLLIEKAKTGKLLPHEYSGGTVSLTNLGMYGITEFSAIINPPQSTILAVGNATKEPIILKDEIHHATILRSTLSVDHRILDGAVAAKFLKDFNDLIEDPFQIWLESKDLSIN